MGLRETIEAAKKEAQEAGGVFSGKKDADAKSEAEEESTGFSRRSAARAKPTTAAASSVRVVSAEDARHGKSGKKSSEMTKEERKAERSSVRDAEDRMNMAANALLKQDKEYARTQRMWWILLGVGLGLTVISFGINYMLNRTGADTSGANVLVPVALISLVLAYVCIIGAFIYDLMKARPIRKRVDAEVKGMTKRRLEQIIREDAEREAAEKAAKKK